MKDRKELLRIAYFCVQELRAVLKELDIYSPWMAGLQSGIETQANIIGLDLDNLGIPLSSPLPPPED